MRADARRNHEQVLRAARDVFLERGLDAPLEDVARRAGVGIGTLYRRFGDRDGLVRAVLLEALAQSRDAAEEALADEDEAYDGLDRLATYLRRMLDARVAAIMPMAVARGADPALDEPRETSARAVQALVTAAHDDGTLGKEVSSGDVGTLLVRLSRPLPGDVDPALDSELAHRQRENLLAGLRAGVPALEGEGPSRGDLRRGRSG
jgi:AcrR family transcriptional regulator